MQLGELTGYRRGEGLPRDVALSVIGRSQVASKPSGNCKTGSFEPSWTNVDGDLLSVLTVAWWAPRVDYRVSRQKRQRLALRKTCMLQCTATLSEFKSHRRQRMPVSGEAGLRTHMRYFLSKVV